MTYISDLRLQLRPFRPSYFLGLNELVGPAYVQNLGLLMKQAPSDAMRFVRIITDLYGDKLFFRDCTNPLHYLDDIDLKYVVANNEKG